MVYFSNQVTKLLSLKVSTNAASYYFHCTTRLILITLVNSNFASPVVLICQSGQMAGSHGGYCFRALSVRWALISGIASGIRPSGLLYVVGQGILHWLSGLHSVEQDIPEISLIFFVSFLNISGSKVLSGWGHFRLYFSCPEVSHTAKSRFTVGLLCRFWETS